MVQAREAAFEIASTRRPTWAPNRTYRIKVAAPVDIQNLGFTKLSGDKHPSEICVLLHNLYSVFDRLTDIYGVYKVETIGDAYEAVSGLDLRSKVGDKRSMLTEKEIK